MNFTVEDEKHSISNVKNFKESNIVWNSTGYNDFIIFRGKDISDVNLKENQDLQQIISNNEKKLLENSSLDIDGCSIYHVDKTQKDTGGFDTNGIPGIYAVYGCNLSDDNQFIETVYYNSSYVRIVSVLVTISVSIDNHYIKKGKLFSRGNKYSRYKKISINKAVKNISNDMVSYLVNGFKGAVPVEVLKNGGDFYVKCDENQEIEILSGGGIAIQRV